jgi:hypothetical protein
MIPATSLLVALFEKGDFCFLDLEMSSTKLEASLLVKLIVVDISSWSWAVVLVMRGFSCEKMNKES